MSGEDTEWKISTFMLDPDMVEDTVKMMQEDQRENSTELIINNCFDIDAFHDGPADR